MSLSISFLLTNTSLFTHTALHCKIPSIVNLTFFKLEKQRFSSNRKVSLLKEVGNMLTESKDLSLGKNKDDGQSSYLLDIGIRKNGKSERKKFSSRVPRPFSGRKKKDGGCNEKNRYFLFNPSSSSILTHHR